MKLYSVDIPIVATAYIKAASSEEALSKAQKLRNLSLELSEDPNQEIPICGKPFDDPDLPEVSLSPAMTICRLPDGTDPMLRSDDIELPPVLPPYVRPDRPYGEWGF